MRLNTLLLIVASFSEAIAAPAANADPAPNERSVSTNKKRSNFWFAGVNESGVEFGNTNIPDKLGTEYTWPLTSSVDTLTGKGFNIFRIPFLMEHLVPSGLYNGVDSTYLPGLTVARKVIGFYEILYYLLITYKLTLTTLVNHITNKGEYAAICAQNFGRYNGNIITDPSGFQAFWKTVASQFKSNKNVIFDTNNEYHDMDNSLVGQLNQAAINGIRAAGATQHTIFVEGNSYTGAWTWVSSGNDTAMAALTDPSDNVIYEMHQYLDSDGAEPVLLV